MSSRSKLNEATILAVNNVPPSEMVGGTDVDKLLYCLYGALHYARTSGKSDRTLQFIETSIRHVINEGVGSSTRFTVSGEIKKSFLRSFS